MKSFKPPHLIELNGLKSIFLAGTIDNGNSEDWQSRVEDYFKNYSINLYNPRRKAWDSSWEQTFENPQFFQQVTWELDALEKADYIIMYFAEGSKSPISLLELGLMAKSGKLLVYCPDSFYRKGNIQIVCNKYNIPMYKNLPKLLEKLENEIS